MKKLLFYQIIFLQLVFFSCSKLEDPKGINMLSSIYKSDTLIDPSNLLNECDSSGIIHNQIMDIFIQHFLMNYNSLNDLDSCRVIIYNYFNISSIGRSIIDSMMGYALIEKENYDQVMQRFYNLYPNVLDFYSEVRVIALNTNFSLSEKLSRLKTLENSYDYSGLSEEQVMKIKTGMSIARYSLYYWAPLTEGGLGKLDSSINVKLKTPINWTGVAIDDAWGAWGSALFTWNPFTALAGGIVTSAISATRTYINSKY